jgi:lipooligosaccharide transport system permease protein
MTATERSATPHAAPPDRPAWTRLVPGGSTHLLRPLRLVERNANVLKRNWLTFLSVFLEPLLFLLSIGVGVGALVGDVEGPGGAPMSYRSFVSAGLLATAAMIGPVMDCTFGFFVKLKYWKAYDAVLATPMGPADVAWGEILWSLFRSAVYAGGFVLTMVAFGLVSSWWAVLCVPVAVLIGFAFAGAGLGASTYMRSFIDFDMVNAAVIPMFLFSATFFPLSRYPDVLQWVVRVTPLYQGVELERRLLVGELHWSMLVQVIYLVVMGAVGLRVASRRLQVLLQP